MNKEALIRFCCRQENGEQLVLPYLEAIEGTGLGVRVMPLGALQFMGPPWDVLGHVFLRPLRPRFINVVCSPPALPLVPGGGQTALAGLFTLGIPNIAITTGEGAYTPKELATLRLYNRVIVPDARKAAALEAECIPFDEIPPEPEALSLLFSGITIV